eukprot:m.1616399 g.1616399  ORF g.1616399 m.1616399 type:complete len:82 (-) comp25372_c0_seq44:202-447(-)
MFARWLASVANKGHSLAGRLERLPDLGIATCKRWFINVKKLKHGGQLWSGQTDAKPSPYTAHMETTPHLTTVCKAELAVQS